MKCKHLKCNNEVSGKQLFCSDKCRKAQSRTQLGQTSKSDSAVGQVIDTVKPEQLITQPMLDSLPIGVVHPSGQPDEHTARLSALDLKVRLNAIKDWQASTVYAEVVYRLLTSTLEQLEQSGQFVPAWRGQWQAA